MKKDSNKYAWEVASGNNDKWNVFKSNNSKDKFKTISYLLQIHMHFFCVGTTTTPGTSVGSQCTLQNSPGSIKKLTASDISVHC